MLKRLKNFLNNTAGNFAVTGALMMLPVMGSVGAAVDFTNFINQRNSVQQALDAAGLASGRHVNTGVSEAELKEYAEKFFQANLDDSIDLDKVAFSLDLTEGDSSVEPPLPTTISLDATLTYDTIFGNLIAVDEISAEIAAKIALGNRTVEVALVMDNSGSMSTNNRIGTMRTETLKLIDTIYNASQYTDLPDPVKFSVVPFGSSVNIGTGNKNKNWMDRKGWSPIHHENFDWMGSYQTTNQMKEPKYQGNPKGYREKINGSWKWKTRHDVFDMLGTEWKGCVEMRPWPHNVMDTHVMGNKGYTTVLNSMDADNDGTKDGTSALFVPYFAPDEPNSTVKYTWSYYGQYDDDYYQNSYLNDWRAYKKGTGSINIYADDNGGLTDNQGNAIDTNQKGATDQINRTDWLFKYQSDSVPSPSSYGSWSGPNASCTTDPIVQLTTNRTTVESAVNGMQALGGTNIQQGLTWGWRTLSDNEPFTEGRADDDNQNMKYIILLTDGNNFYSTDGDSTPNRTGYGAWGYARDGQNRWAKGLDSADLDDTIYQSANFDLTPESNSEFELIMNAHTNQACRNVKNDGISIFTIAFDVSNGSSVKDLLEACAGSGVKDNRNVIAGGKFYYDVNGGELEQAMADIANQIADMRITN